MDILRRSLLNLLRYILNVIQFHLPMQNLTYNVDNFADSIANILIPCATASNHFQILHTQFKHNLTPNKFIN